MHVKASPEPVRPAVDPDQTPRENYERALTAGPWHQPWPFHCFYCGDVLHTDAHYPYCSIGCSVHAEQS